MDAQDAGGQPGRAQRRGDGGARRQAGPVRRHRRHRIVQRHLGMGRHHLDPARAGHQPAGPLGRGRRGAGRQAGRVRRDVTARGRFQRHLGVGRHELDPPHAGRQPAPGATATAWRRWGPRLSFTAGTISPGPTTTPGSGTARPGPSAPSSVRPRVSGTGCRRWRTRSSSSAARRRRTPTTPRPGSGTAPPGRCARRPPARPRARPR